MTMGPFFIPTDLAKRGWKAHSQNDEDGIIAAIFHVIGRSSSYAVEFGIGPNYLDREYKDGLEGNTVILRKQGWDVLLMDGGTHPEHFDVRKHFITASNINDLFTHYSVPSNVDLVSIDVDGQDYWIWKALKWRPRVVILEYNPNFSSITDRFTIAYDEDHRWDGTRYYGASFGALVALGRDLGYVAVTGNGVNLFFVREDLIMNSAQFDPQTFMQSYEMHMPDTLDRPWVQV
jgi:hypothetical protein